MVLEHALLAVRPGEEEAFTAVLGEALGVITRSPGCRSARVLRGHESPSTFLLLVEWDSLEDHLDGFRRSPDFELWRSLVGPFWVELPDVQHFLPSAASPT
jgi:heme-degrading monooxygenase HmoA